MAPNSPALFPSDQGGAIVPIAGDFMGLLVALASISVLSICIYQRCTVIKVWGNLPAAVWLVLVIYVDSICFVVAATILQQMFGVNSSYGVCHGAILLCLVFYGSTKILIYVFLAEKAYIIRGTPKTRLQSKLYLFNSFGMLSLFAGVIVLNFIFRTAKIDDRGVCIIGMKRVALIPLVTFDAIVNIYLTILFLTPLKNLYSFKSMPKTAANERLRNVAFRTFVGSCLTLLGTIVNLSVLIALDGEPGWVCLMCCTSEILFAALVVHWVTSKDNAGSGSSQTNTNPFNENSSRRDRDPHGTAHQMSRIPVTPPSPNGTDAEISLVGPATAQSSDDGRATEIAKVSTTSGGGGVVVTTTIHRQSRPTDAFDLDMDDNKPGDDDYATFGYQIHPHTQGKRYSSRQSTTGVLSDCVGTREVPRQ